MKGLISQWLTVLLILIFAYLVLKNWRGAVGVLKQAGGSTIGIIDSLQN